MWTAIGVGILVTWQAAFVPAGTAGSDRKPSVAAAEAGGDSDESPPAAAPAPVAPAQTGTTLYFRSDVGKGFGLTEARFELDGRDLPTVLTTAEHSQGYVIFTGPLAPGRHVLTSHVSYQAHARSIFTYVAGYKFNLDTDHELQVPATGTLSATVVGSERKGFNVPFEQSLTLTFEMPAVGAAAGTPAVPMAH